MNVHKNAPLTPKGREAMARSVVEGGLTQADAAYQFNTTPKTVAKWVKRFRAEGVEGLHDRSSRPHSSPSQTPPATCTAIEALRRQRHTGKQIAVEVEVSPATGLGPRASRALVRDNRRINHLAPMRLQRLQRRDLVYTHQTAVADDIGGKIAARRRACSFGQPRFPKTLNQQLRV